MSLTVADKLAEWFRHDPELLMEVIEALGGEVQWKCKDQSDMFPCGPKSWVENHEDCGRYAVLPLVGRYKAPNRKGVRHEWDCLHDEPGVTICTCSPVVDAGGGSAKLQSDAINGDYGDGYYAPHGEEQDGN